MDKNLAGLSDELISTLLNNPYETMIIIDADGIVRFMSPASDGAYNLSCKDAVGQHVSKAIPDEKLIRVLKTGKAEIGRVVAVKGKSRVIARIPLKREDRIIGVVGKLLFNDPEKLKQLYGRIDTLEKNLSYYKEELGQVYGNGIRYSFAAIIGDSDLIRKAKILGQQAAESDSPVIITGESGTGKELFSHAIHRASNRCKQNFIRVNCAAIPNELIEAEMFGYEAGAFTGAKRKGKPGKFELAHKGTIFLDEIGDMPLNMQVKIMRVLQEKEVERIGGDKPKRIDFRLISATNQDLEKMIKERTFRLDLYYRLNVINIKLPALREIREDIPLIFKDILKKLLVDKKSHIPTVASEVMEALQRYHWPGNARELRNVAERALIIHHGNCIELKDLPISVQQSVSLPKDPSPPLSTLKSILADAERNAIIQTLKQTGNNKVQAARVLRIHRTGIYQKIKKYGITTNKGTIS